MAKASTPGNKAAAGIQSQQTTKKKDDFYTGDSFIDSYLEARINGSSPLEAGEIAHTAVYDDGTHYMVPRENPKIAEGLENGTMYQEGGRTYYNDEGLRQLAQEAVEKKGDSAYDRWMQREGDHSLGVGGAIGGGALSGLWNNVTGLFNLGASAVGKKISDDDLDTWLGKTGFENAGNIRNSYMDKLKEIWSDGSFGSNVKDSLFATYDAGWKDLLEGSGRIANPAIDAIAKGSNVLFKVIRDYVLPKVTGSKDAATNAKWLTDQAYGLSDKATEAVASKGGALQYVDPNIYQTALQNSSNAARIAGNTSNVVANMLPSILVSFLTKDPDAGLGLMAGTAAGSSAKEAYGKGTSAEQAFYTGAEKGYVEYLTERMFDAIGAFGGGVISDKLKRLLNDIALTKAGRAVMKLADIYGENIEEAVSDWASPGIDKAVWGNEDDEDLSVLQALAGQAPWTEEGLITLLSTLVMGGMSSAVRNNVITVPKEQAEEILNIARNSGNERLVALAEEYNQILERKGKLGVEKAQYLQEATERTMGEEAYRDAVNARSEELKQQAVERTISAAFSQTDTEAGDEAIKTLASGYGTGDADLVSYVSAVQEAYHLGQMGLSLETATKNAKNAGSITDKQFRNAWQLGSHQQVTSENNADMSTVEGKEKLTASLKALGKYADAAAAVYDSKQDVSRYAAAMNKAINLYAASGADVKTIAQEAKSGNTSDIVSYLTEAQLEKAAELGAQVRVDNQKQAKEGSSRFADLRKRAAAVIAAGNNSAQALNNIDKALGAAKKYGQEQYDLFVQKRDALEQMVKADPNAANTEAYTKLYDEALENYRNAEKMQETVKELEEKRKEIQDRQPVKRKKGTVSFEGGIDPNTGKQLKAVDQSKLSKHQKNVVSMVEALADIINIDYVFFDGDSHTGGEYIGDGVIYININSGVTRNFAQGIAAASLSHELTHFMQEFAPEEYGELKDFIVSEVMKKSPSEFDALVKQQLAWEPDLSYDRAVDEVIANSCQNMLLNSEYIAQFAREHMTAAEKVADTIHSIVDKIKAAYDGIDFKSKQGPFRAVQAVIDQSELIQKRWDKALKAAAENYNAAQTVRGQSTAERTETRAAAQKTGVQYQRTTDKHDTVRVQILKAQETLNSMDVVADVDVSDAPKGVKNIRKWAYNRLKSTGFETERRGFGRIIFDDSRINDALNHILHRPNEMLALAALPRVLKRGIQIDYHVDTDGRIPLESFTFAAPIKINGVRGNMAAVVQRTTKNYYHTHRVLLPDGSNFTFDNNKTESKPSGELPAKALIAKTIDSASEEKIPEVSKNVKGQNQQWDNEEVIPVKQEISSAATSINANKLPILYTNKYAQFAPGGTNIDIGGGRFDNVTEYLAGKGVKNLVFDPYNRSEETNAATLKYLQDGNLADTATCSNCLNVIKEAAARDNVILETAKAIKPDGKAYFTVYEGNESGVGKVTKAGWQENRKTASYVSEIRKYFDAVTAKGKMIIAENPKTDLPKAAWETSPGKATRFQQWDDEHPQLMAVHNKSVSGLKRMLERNGVPFPSIAIKKAGTPHQGFGDVSIVFPRSTIDPQANRQNRLYSNDAWSPTEPHVDYDVGNTYRYVKKLNNLVGNEMFSALRGQSYLEESELARRLSYNNGDIVESLKNITALKYAYLQSIGKTPKIPARTEDLDRFHKYKNEQLMAIFDSMMESEIENLDYDSPLLERVAEILNEQFRSQYAGNVKTFAALLRTPPYRAEKINPNAIKDAYHKYVSNGKSILLENDFDEFDRIMRADTELENSEGYRKWLEDYFKDLIVDSGIYNGKDIYTNSGNRRSFKQLHVPATLENIVAEMKKQQERGVGMVGINLRGAATKTYNTVEEMRSESGKLLGERIDDDVYDSYMSEFHSRLHDMSRQAAKSERWETIDSAEEILLEAIRDSRSEQDMDRRLKKEAQWINYSQELAQDLWQLRNDVQNMPAPYFEAKPRRIVYPEEALAYILPDNADSSVLDQLKDRGYNVLTYEAGNEEDRLAKLNSVEAGKFQKWSNPDQISLDDWLQGDIVKYGNLHPDIRKRLDDAAALEREVKGFFESVPEDNENYLDPDEIDSMMEVNPYGGDGDMDNAEQIVMNLSDISQGMNPINRETVYFLMDELLPHLSVYAQGNWTEERWSQNKDFTEWYSKRHPSLYYPGYQPGQMNLQKELDYLRDYLQKTSIPEADRQQAQALYNSIIAHPEATFYQKWDSPEDDTQSEAEGREIAYARIQSENALLKETVEGLRKLTGKQSTTIARLEKQLHLTKTPEVRQSDANRFASRLIRDHSSTVSKSEIAADLKALGDYILQTPTDQIDEDIIKLKARAIAEKIVESAEEVDDKGGELEKFKAIAGDVRGKKITIDKEFLGELDGGYEEFRKKNFGNFTLAKRETGESRDGYETVGSLYDTLRSVYGEYYFPEPGQEGAKNEGEQISLIAKYFQAAKGVAYNPNNNYMGEAVEELANRIAFDALDGVMRQTEPTMADKQKARADALREQIRELKKQGAIDEKEADRLRETVYDLTLALDKASSRYTTLSVSAEERFVRMQAEGRARAAEIKALERARANEKIAALKEHYQDVASRARDRREESAGVSKYRKQVEKKAKALSDMLLTNSDKLHVPEVLKTPLAEFLSALDFSSKRRLRGGADTQADVKFGARLQKLQQLLSQQQSYINGTGEMTEDLGGYIDVSPDNLEYLREMAQQVTDALSAGRDFTINQMSAEELRNLSKLLSNLKSAISNMNNFMANARYESVREAADQDISQMDKYGRADEREHNMLNKLFKWENATPYYTFRRFGEGGVSIFKGLRNGWDKMAFNVQEIINFTQNLYTSEEVNKWKSTVHEIRLDSGETVRMTTAQIMALSTLLNRAQAVQHIERGGVRIGDIKTKTGKISDVSHYHLTGNDIDNMLGILNNRQMEVARALQRYMTTKGAEWGNEVSMRRFGYNFYTEGENYYPIKTDSNDRPMADTDAMQNSMFRLLNLSSSKSLNPKASNALIIDDIFDTFADHMADQAKLNGLGLPILDAIKWFNYKERINYEDGTYDIRSMQAAMEQAFGAQAQSYFRTLMKDINGVTESGDRGKELYSKLTSNYKVAAVAANLRVALLQPTSYVRASFLIDPKYLAAAFLHKNAYKEAMEYSGTAVWKSLGYYDTNIARNMRDQIQHNDSWKDDVVEKTMLGAELGDKLTWGRLWVACKLQAQAQNRGISAEELKQKTADLFQDVVYSSQVMDSTLTRSALMRSSSAFNKMLTPFMAEPTLSYNILLDAYSQWQLDARENGKANAWAKNSKVIGKALTVYAASAAFAALAESVWDAVRDSDDEPFIDKFLDALLGEKFDDEEDENETVKDAFFKFLIGKKTIGGRKWLSGNLWQDIDILQKLPYLKNVISLIQGYGNSDMLTSGFNLILQSYKIWAETLSLEMGYLDKPTNITYYGHMTPWGKIYKSLQGLSQVSGLPISAALRDAFAIWNTVVGSTKPDWKIRTYDGAQLSGKKKDAYKEFVSGNGISEREYSKILTAANADGNTNVSQAELSEYLKGEIASGNLTKAQADAIWQAQGWKKTFNEYTGSAKSGSTASTKQTAAPASALATPKTNQNTGVSNYTDFKNSVPLYGSDKKQASYSVWESVLKPSGMTLERFTQILGKADTDSNGSLKQDELGYALRAAVNSREMTFEQASAVWNAQGWSAKHSFDYWSSRH